MNEIGRAPALDVAEIERQIVARDSQVDNMFSEDFQVMAIRNASAFRPDKISRVARPHRNLDPAHGPLIAVRLNILTRAGEGFGGEGTFVGGRIFSGRQAGRALGRRR
jgi:predicted oxidoreductase